MPGKTRWAVAGTGSIATRTLPDLALRRAVRIALTPAGRDLVAEVTRQRRAELARLLGALAPEEHEPVIAAFRAFAAAAGELPQPGAALGWAGP